jgi:hypothetical protein
MDKEQHEKNWDIKCILVEAVVKYNDIGTNEEWIMDLKEANPPPNPLALSAYQCDTKPQLWKGTKDTKEKKNKSNKPDKPKRWKYMAPKAGESDMKTMKNANR